MSRLASSKLRDANGVAVTKVQGPSFSLMKLDCKEVGASAAVDQADCRNATVHEMR
jgi:hypothetical protein